MKYLSDREWVVQIGVDTATGFTPNRGSPRAASLAQYPSCYLLTYGTSRGDLKILAPSTNSMQMTSLS